MPIKDKIVTVKNVYNNFWRIGSIKRNIRNLSSSGLSVQISGNSFPSSRFKVASYALVRANLLSETKDLKRLFKEASKIPPKDMPRGIIDLRVLFNRYKEVAAEVKTASGEFNADFSQVESDAVKEALHYCVDSPQLVAAAENHRTMLEKTIGMPENLSVVELGMEIVRTAQTLWGGANPTLVIKAKNAEGQDCIFPTAVALPDGVIKIGESQIGRLGEVAIRTDLNPDNFYVQAITNQNLEVEMNVSSERARKIIGDFVGVPYTTEGLIGLGFKLAIIPDNNALLTVPLKRVSAETGISENFGMLTIFKSGGFSPQQLREIKLFAKTAEYVITRKQIEEAQTQMYKELKETRALAALAALTPTISHGMKNDLWGVLGEIVRSRRKIILDRAVTDVALAKLEALGSSENKKELESIRRGQTERIKELELERDIIERALIQVKGILGLSKIGEGEEENINIRQFFQEVTGSFQARAQENNIDLSIDLKGVPEEFGIRIVRQCLDDLVKNPLTNSISAFSSSGIPNKKIEILAEINEGNLSFTIKDNAGGMSKEIQESVFDLYKSATSGGTGIGMFVVKETARILNAGLFLESEKGTGTKISVKIPSERILKNVPLKLQESITEASLPDILIPEAAALTKVMVIDDKKYVIRATRGYLKDLGITKLYQYLTAEDALRALQENQVNPDIIICDQTLSPVSFGHNFFIEAAKIYGKGEKPAFIIHSGDIAPRKGEIWEVLNSLGIVWLNKDDPKEFKTTIATIAAGLPLFFKEDSREAQEDEARPVARFAALIAHKANSIYMPFSYAFQVTDVEKSRKYGLTGVEMLDEIAEKFKAFIANPFETSLLPKDIVTDKRFQVLWDEIDEPEKHRIAAFCRIYLNFIEDPARKMKEILTKELFSIEDIRTLELLFNGSIADLNKAIQKPQEAPARLKELVQRHIDVLSDY